MLEDIVRLEKRSKTAPANPCSPQIPLGCSLPQWATLLSSTQSQYKDFFYPSCAQHDYCYRHGAATYGMDQHDCDFQFLEDMRAQCHPDNILLLLLESVTNYTECNALAMEFYQAVQKYGASRFNSTTSTWCEYDGPP
jgi:hypothetical protein